MPYDVAGTDAGNSYKTRKLLTAYDSDAKAAVDFLVASKACNGRIGSTGMCLGGHLVFTLLIRLSKPRPHAKVCFFNRPSGCALRTFRADALQSLTSLLF